ncbi:MFS transporter [Microbacterium soli]|uniref:MFS transporter n=1 Tax=Microbacterium soli TaxID=446075 RepID=A0ABP7MK11_9MICO
MTETDTLPSPTHEHRRHHRRDIRFTARSGFWIISSAFLIEMAFCAVPTPLYAIYQRRDGYPTLVVTVIFAAYAFGVMLSLHLAGHLSDRFGRRRMVFLSLIVNLASVIVFLFWNDVAGLIVARAASGIAIGLLTATATAYLAELGTRTGRRPLVSTVIATFTNLGGIALGPLAAGIIATVSAHPLVWSYIPFGALFLIGLILVPRVPETAKISTPHVPYRPQRIRVPSTSRGVYFAAAAAAFGGFAVFGTFSGLSSTFLVGILHLHSALMAGVAPFIVFISASLAQTLTVHMGQRQQLALAIIAAVAGLGALALSAAGGSLVLFLLGGGLAGAGVGVLFRAALSAVGRIADDAHRGEALAGIFLIAYVGMTIPPLLTAIALLFWSPMAVLTVLSAAIAVLVAIAGSRMLRS